MRNTRLGILGGGQLGRMSALAAANLGITVHIFTPEENSPASQVSDKTTIAKYDDEEALKNFANDVDVISYEFENIPVETVQFLKNIKPVFPDEKLLEVSQDRIQEKSFLNKIGIDTTRWKKLNSHSDCKAAFNEWNSTKLILKTTRFGYDGKGQAKLKNSDNYNDTVSSLKGEIIIEEIVDFDYEISVICARDKEKKSVTYGPMRNEHRNHILHKTTVPAHIPDEIKQQSISMVKKIADHIDLIGVLTLELFVTKDERVLANEIAPRTHNSGHWTIDACHTSQFDQHVRSVCGLPVLPPTRHSDVEMINLIGDDILDLDEYRKNPDVVIHDYGKEDVRPGRKMGHINILKDKS